MSLNAECSSALQLLEHIQASIQKTDDSKLQSQTAEDLNMLISVFSNPILRSIVCVQVGYHVTFYWPSAKNLHNDWHRIEPCLRVPHV